MYQGTNNFLFGLFLVAYDCKLILVIHRYFFLNVFLSFVYTPMVELCEIYIHPIWSFLYQDIKTHLHKLKTYNHKLPIQTGRWIKIERILFIM